MAETAPPASNPQMRIGARTGSRRACGDTNKRAASSRSGGVSCEMPLCNKNPSFAYMGEKRRRFCKRHAEPGMVNAYYKYCDVDQCRERAAFESSEGKVRRCLAHRESGMVPRSKICQVEGGGCARQSSYGPEGGRPVLCTIHKLPGMVQVRTRTCKQPGCTKIPSYGFLCKSRDYCKAHAQEGMVYYSAGSKCQYRGCGTPGTFNHLSARGGSFCSRHKQEGMVDVSRRTCEGIGCIYEAKYGSPEQRTKRFCARHKLEGMLTLEDMGKQMDAGDRTPLDFRSGMGEISTSRVDYDGGSEESGSNDATSPCSASNDATTVEANTPVPGSTRPGPRTTDTKGFTEAKKRAPVRRLAPALGRRELSSGFSPIPLPLAPLLGSRATAAGVLFPGLILPGLAEASPWNPVLLDTQPPLLPGYFASAANVQRTTSDPFSPVLGSALPDVACLAAAADKMTPMRRASTAGATGSSISNGVSHRNPWNTINASPDLSMPGASTVSQAQVHITSGRDGDRSRDTVSLSELSPEHTCLPGIRAGVRISRGSDETLVLPPGGSVSERNRTKGMDDDSLLVCLIDSMDPADLKNGDLKGAVLSRLRRVRRMVDR